MYMCAGGHQAAAHRRHLLRAADRRSSGDGSRRLSPHPPGFTPVHLTFCAFERKPFYFCLSEVSLCLGDPKLFPPQIAPQFSMPGHPFLVTPAAGNPVEGEGGREDGGWGGDEKPPKLKRGGDGWMEEGGDLI